MALQKPTYTQIPNDFIDKYMCLLSKEAALIFIAICRKTIGWHKDTDIISQSQLLNMTPIKSVNGLKKAIKELINVDLITVEQSGTGKNIKTIYEIKFQSSDDISYDDIIKANNVSSHDTKSKTNVSPHDTTKETININKEYKETATRVLLYLNEKMKKDTKPTQYTLKFIIGRLKEGYTEAECKRVIDIKISHWLKDPKCEEWLNYTTLFRPTNFPKYLNEKKKVWIEVKKWNGNEYVEEWTKVYYDDPRATEFYGEEQTG